MDKLIRELRSYSERYSKLKGAFDTFAQAVAEQVGEAGAPVPGIHVELHADQAYFDATFSGRTFRLRFSSELANDGANHIGVVRCYRVPGDPGPHERLSPSSWFTFDRHGQTDVTDPQDGDAYYMDVEGTIAATLLLLTLIHPALERCDLDSLKKKS